MPAARATASNAAVNAASSTEARPSAPSDPSASRNACFTTATKVSSFWWLTSRPGSSRSMRSGLSTTPTTGEQASYDARSSVTLVCSSPRMVAAAVTNAASLSVLAEAVPIAANQTTAMACRGVAPGPPIGHGSQPLDLVEGPVGARSAA